MQNLFKLLSFCLALIVFQACQPSSSGVSSLTPEGGLNWLTIDEAQAINNVEEKRFIVDMYTTWCGWCKKMDAQTFNDPEVKAFIDQNFFVVKMDAETKDTVNFKGKEYEWRPGGRKGINTLALELLGGRQSYPTIVYLDKDLNKIKSIPGFKQKDQFIKDLKDVLALDGKSEG